LRAVTRWLPSWLSRPDQTRPAAAVYMSPKAVAVAKGERVGDRFHVHLRADPIDQLAAARDVLKLQSHDVGLKSTSCNLVLAPELYSVSLVERPPVADEELVDAVRWRIQENVEFPVDTATLDVFPMPEAATRDRPMVFVVAMQTEFLKVLLDKVYEADIQVSSVDVAELAMRNIVHGLFPEPDQGVALLRLTSASGVINISRGEELFLSRRVTGVPATFEADAWEAYRERLLLQVQRSIDYYESAMSQPPVNGCMIATTHGWQDRICDYLSEMMPVPIRPIRAELRTLFDLCLFNPEPEKVDWDDVSVDQRNAITAALPALGGLLRRIRDDGEGDVNPTPESATKPDKEAVS